MKAVASADAKQEEDKIERKSMNNQFDELAKGMAQSVTRRAALKKFGVGLAGMALACFGLANKGEAGPCKPGGANCHDNSECCSGYCLAVPFSKKHGVIFACTY